MLADTHCHLDFPQFEPDREAVLRRAQEAGLEFMITVGADIAGSRRCLELARRHDILYASAGIHPHAAAQAGRENLAALGRMLNEKKVLALGEVGLDYYDPKTAGKTVSIAVRRRQKAALRAMLELSADKKPLILHCREAGDDLLEILRGSCRIPVSGVMHCFSHDLDFLKRCLGLGLYVSFTANITYKKSERLREAVRYAPLDRILLETDAPFLAPQALRGKRNEPAYVSFVAGEIARIKKIDAEAVGVITTVNAGKCFRISSGAPGEQTGMNGG